uniref:TraB/GumN family protein n=1 Tax=Phenylobacterium glaciei TaxID=2803784 RepID=A0A974P818_9CAUL|nr:TraB/GumN family protein [Phenylobacterium glaciei]
MAAQVASLEDSLTQMDKDPDAYDRLIASWMAADTAALEKDALTPLKTASPVLYARLVSDRNAAWTKVLDERLKGHGHTVVVVGVGHLLTADGVPARLRALGYSVEGP